MRNIELEKELYETLEEYGFELERDNELKGTSIKRDGEYYADIYDDGRITTCYTAFMRMDAYERVHFTKILSNYVTYMLFEGVAG